jgi:hypothetical protein
MITIMASNRQLIEVRAPFLGYWSGSNPQIDPRMFTRCTNILFDKSGCAGKRPGFTSYDTAPAILGTVTIDGMFAYTKQGTTGSPVTKNIFHAGGSIFAVPAGSNLSAATAIKTGMTAGETVDHAVLSDRYFCANGSQVLQYYDGTTIANITTPPASGLTGTFTPAIVEVHRWSLWAAGVPGNPSRLFKSVPQDGTDFNTNLAAFNVTDGYALAGASQIDVRPDDGTRITELVGDHFGQLIIFKENSIHRLLGATKADYALPPEGVIDGIGAIRGSMVRANNDIYFASTKGIHRLSTVQTYGDNQASYISAPIKEYYDGLDKYAMKQKCQAIHWPEESIVIWSFPVAGSGTNNTLLVYHYDVNPPAGAWSIWTGVNVASMGIFPYDGTDTLFIGDYSSRIGMCNKANYNDFGSAYTMEAEILFDAGTIYGKHYRTIIFICKTSGSGGISVKARPDSELWTSAITITPNTGGTPLGSFVLGVDVLADSSAVGQGLVEINRSGRVLRVNFQNGTVNESVSILGFAIEFMPTKIFKINP